MESNNAIVCLTRGYHNMKSYATLIERNKAIKEFINKDNQYPLVIFHEGNITEEHQDYITHFAEGQRLIFKDISDVWVGGYESMCRFQTIHIWEYCKDYDYIMRIDEDCTITECATNPFELVNDNVYLRSVYFAESHSETNATLPQRIEELTGVSREEFYNDKFVYTNVGLGSVKFWLEQPMYNLIKEIGMCQDQLTNRWGDLPVLGSLLNIYAKGKVGAMIGLKYKHYSHNNVIDCNGID